MKHEMYHGTTIIYIKGDEKTKYEAESLQEQNYELKFV